MDLPVPDYTCLLENVSNINYPGESIGMNLTIFPSQHPQEELPGIKTETDEHRCQSKKYHIESYDGCFQCHPVGEMTTSR